jgi:hypothetical protein
MDKEKINESVYNNILNRLTIEYLTNIKQKTKIQQEKHKLASSLNKKDKKFYRRRILNLTKEMLLNNYPDDLLQDVNDSFDNFLKSCIGYFKLKDETEIIQEEYKIDSLLDEIIQQKLDEDDIVTPEEADKLMMRSITLHKKPLDNFVKIKYLKTKEDIILPIQKEINLKEPHLKKKGIPEKKIISQSYNNENKKETENENKSK